MASRAIVQGVNWKKRISVNLAGALLMLAALQILCFGALAEELDSPLISLVGLVIVGGLAMPAMRRMEARWHAEADHYAGEEMAERFASVRNALWLGALMLPFASSAALYGFHRLAGYFAT